MPKFSNDAKFGLGFNIAFDVSHNLKSIFFFIDYLILDSRVCDCLKNVMPQTLWTNSQGFAGLTLGFSDSWAYGKGWPCFPKVLPGPVKPDPPYALWGVTANVFGLWMVLLALGFYV
jgi:hypothetical protein